MGDINTVVLQGRIAKPPEVREKIAWFLLEVKSERSARPDTIFCKTFELTYFRVIEGLHEGDEVKIKGYLRREAWGEKDARKYDTVVVFNQMQVVGQAPRQEASRARKEPSREVRAAQPETPPEKDDDLPF